MNQPMQVLTSQRTNEWYTPPWITDKVKKVFGGHISLDPASGPIPQAWIKASAYYSKEDNGLSLPWIADSVFVNPPYNRNANVEWSNKFISEYRKGNFRQGILLVYAKHGYNWFDRLYQELFLPVCFLKGRIQFIPDHLLGYQSVAELDQRVGLNNMPKKFISKHGSCLFYVGDKVDKFTLSFLGVGRIQA